MLGSINQMYSYPLTIQEAHKMGWHRSPVKVAISNNIKIRDIFTLVRESCGDNAKPILGYNNATSQHFYHFWFLNEEDATMFTLIWS